MVTTLQSLHVSEDQLRRCHRIEANGSVYYQVESESSPGTVYKVSWDGKWHCTCPCGQQNFRNSHSGTCKHCKWSAAHAIQYRQEKAKLEAAKEAMIMERAQAGDIKRNGKTARHYFVKTYKPHGLGEIRDLGYLVEPPLSVWQGYTTNPNYDLVELFRSGRRWLVADKRSQQPARELAPLNGNKAFSLMR